jgi:hypothetical protein
MSHTGQGDETQCPLWVKSRHLMAAADVRFAPSRRPVTRTGEQELAKTSKPGHILITSPDE